ncbi:Acyl-protein thioesterase 1 [Termitomyces sp. T112]|nr:Acyl-protein thioesterase 1 [Termitomyces sp. T112]
MDDQSDAQHVKKPYTCITIEPTQKHTATVVWLHGLGGTGNSMLGPATILLDDTRGLEHVKFIFPTAHVMKVTGAKAFMNSWQDCFSFDYETREEDEQGFRVSASLIDDIIAREEREHSIPPNRVVVGGISQGSSTALYTALTSTRPLAGVFILAGYIPLRGKIKQLISRPPPLSPIFWGHGRLDDRLEIDFSLNTARTLASDLGVPFTKHVGRFSVPNIMPISTDGETRGLTEDSLTLIDEDRGVAVLKQPSVHFVTYEQLGHWMNEAELLDLGAWFCALLPKDFE